MQGYRLPLNMHGATDEEEAEEAERMLTPYTHANERMAHDALAYSLHHTPIPIDHAAGSKRGSTDAGSAMVRHCSQYRPYTHTYTPEQEEAEHDALASANAHMSPSAILLERAAAAAMLYSESTGTGTGPAGR
jgi:hypothetical protein